MFSVSSRRQSHFVRNRRPPQAGFRTVFREIAFTSSIENVENLPTIDSSLQKFGEMRLRLANIAKIRKFHGSIEDFIIRYWQCLDPFPDRHPHFDCPGTPAF